MPYANIISMGIGIGLGGIIGNQGSIIPFPNSWINSNGTINCNGVVYCSQIIPCGE